jgi:hypothetical protein
MGVKRDQPTVSAGDTFLVSHPYNHLYVVCSDPAVDSSQILLVSITTFKPKEETCCILVKGDHPFIKHRSCVRYKDAKLASVDQLIRLLVKSLMSRQSLFPPTCSPAYATALPCLSISRKSAGAFCKISLSFRLATFPSSCLALTGLGTAYFDDIRVEPHSLVQFAGSRRFLRSPLTGRSASS